MSYQVPFLVDFAGKPGHGQFKMGRGNAGWTTREFTARAEAIKFARSIPEQSRMPSYDRMLAKMEEDERFSERSRQGKGTSLKAFSSGASVPSNLQRAYKFFKENAGGVVGESAKGALALAKAEAEASDRGWSVKWEQEEEPDLSWMDEEELKEEHEVLTAILYDEEDNVLGSVGNIVDADRNYARVIEAELALEALSQ